MNILIITMIPAPYRVEVFRRLAEVYNLTVVFEKESDYCREREWYNYDLGNAKYFITSRKNGKKQLLKEISKICDGAYDLVIFYEYSTLLSLILMELCILRKINYSINGDGVVVAGKNRFKDFCKRHFISKARLCLASGIIVKNYFMEYGAKEECIELHNFTSLAKSDLMDHTPTEREQAIARDDLDMRGNKNVIVVGRLIKSKRVEEMIDIWEGMPNNYFLYIIGSGELAESLGEYVHHKKLTNVILTGYKDRDIVLKYMLAADLMAFPSESDVWGLVINEALSRACPVIATNKCIGALELIVNGINGYVINVGDTHDMKAKVLSILNGDNNQEMRNNALNSIRNYTYESVSEAHMNAIDSIARTDEC